VQYASGWKRGERAVTAPEIAAVDILRPGCAAEVKLPGAAILSCPARYRLSQLQGPVLSPIKKGTAREAEQIKADA
jgi:hypothetical protein